MRPRPDAYAPAQKALHWTIAVLIAFMVPAGISMANLMAEGPARDTTYELHKSVGLVILGLAIARVILRALHGAPPLVPGLPAWQRNAARVSHYALYALILLVPLAGWTGTSMCCAPVNVFWTLPLTLPVEGGMERAKAIFAVHATLAITLAGIVLVHAGAALHHHFVRRDRTLLRMLPAAWSASGRDGEEVGVPHDAGRG